MGILRKTIVLRAWHRAVQRASPPIGLVGKFATASTQIWVSSSRAWCRVRDLARVGDRRSAAYRSQAVSNCLREEPNYLAEEWLPVWRRLRPADRPGEFFDMTSLTAPIQRADPKLRPVPNTITSKGADRAGQRPWPFTATAHHVSNKPSDSYFKANGVARVPVNMSAGRAGWSDDASYWQRPDGEPAPSPARSGRFGPPFVPEMRRPGPNPGRFQCRGAP